MSHFENLSEKNLKFAVYTTLFAKVCSIKIKINATSYVKPYDFQKKYTKNGYDSQKFVPQNTVMF